MRKHLDLGCGKNPRNPYFSENVYGIDLDPSVTVLGDNFQCVNLSVDPIPYSDSFFDSISAFDFLEHLPRQAIDFEKKIIHTPFINVMSEIHRTLKPNGMFYAVTPAYPSNEAFQDPTHVNFITNRTHEYFCGNEGLYGFKGNFEAIEIKRINISYALTSKRNLTLTIKNLHKKYFKSGVSHIVWQLKAIK
jgi:SAM-dependent methyltransferase